MYIYYVGMVIYTVGMLLKKKYIMVNGYGFEDKIIIFLYLGLFHANGGLHDSS